MTKIARPTVQASAPRRLTKRAAATITLKEWNEPPGPESNGILMTPEEFDALEVEDVRDDWEYELINGVFVVTPIPLEEEIHRNEELGFLLRYHQLFHPQGASLNLSLPERYIRLRNSRRRADRVIWAGLGRLPYRKENPTIAVAFVSRRKRDRVLDYETKRDEYMGVQIKKYWIIDRFMQTMTVYRSVRGKVRRHVIQKDEVYRTDVRPLSSCHWYGC